MPIYAYRCESCGFGKDVLQKLSDAPLTQCPECGKATFAKQVTAAGFQLKGSGWYVTDFRGGNNNGKAAAPAADKPSGEGAKSEGAAGGEAKSEGAAGGEAKSGTASASTESAKPSAATPAAPSTPASSGTA